MLDTLKRYADSSLWMFFCGHLTTSFFNFLAQIYLMADMLYYYCNY